MLQNAILRRTTESLAFNSQENLEVVGSTWKEAIISVLVRKATGGAKGMSRSLAGMRGGDVIPVEEVVMVNPMNNPGALGSGGGGGGHGGLDLSFNLSITDEQRRRRGEVPLPYAHEGEGPSGEAVLEFDEEEEEDDEEI
jgi:elongator complex protein 5